MISSAVAGRCALGAARPHGWAASKVAFRTSCALVAGFSSDRVAHVCGMLAGVAVSRA
jgi:hypothetical protein